MLAYRVQYNESESDIQNYNLFYKKDTKSQNIFDFLEKFLKIEKTHFYFVLCINCIIHILYFLEFL